VKSRLTYEERRIIVTGAERYSTLIRLFFHASCRGLYECDSVIHHRFSDKLPFSHAATLTATNGASRKKYRPMKSILDAGFSESLWEHFPYFVFHCYLRQWNEVNIGGDYEIGRSVCPCVCVSVYVSVRLAEIILRAPSNFFLYSVSCLFSLAPSHALCPLFSSHPQIQL